MRFRQLDLNLLVALDALLDSRSVTAAAQQMNLSQAAMSNALARLRRHFDDPLLVRAGREMVMTARAQSLRGEVRELLDRIEASVFTPAPFDPAQRARNITLHAADAAAIGVIARLGRHLHRHAPGITLSLRPLSDDSWRALDRGEADLLLVPRQYAATDQPMAQLYTEPFRVLACREGAYAEGPLTQAAYLTAEHVTVELGGDRKVPVDRAIIEHGHGRLRAGITVSSQAMVAWHVTGTDRLGTVPASLAAEQCAVLPLVSHPLPLEVPPLQMVLQWRRLAEGDPTLEWLRGVLTGLLDHSPD
ncbi:LysR family transcriptional regulator [Pararhodobacter sp. CCB-MM2]|uniref:LysR family transcriptional regulator n=1 Tax=Pararhodobacter sp. CCB-MM2 TaxID=1786003 RepID=UPI00082F3E28|nr:LysR family transcriptional regulator [Pararhodobacter sp. CCB-MM2]